MPRAFAARGVSFCPFLSFGQSCCGCPPGTMRPEFASLRGPGSCRSSCQSFSRRSRTPQSQSRLRHKSGEPKIQVRRGRTARVGTGSSLRRRVFRRKKLKNNDLTRERTPTPADVNFAIRPSGLSGPMVCEHRSFYPLPKPCKRRVSAPIFANRSRRHVRPFVCADHKYVETRGLQALGAPESYKSALRAPRFANRTENRACGPEPLGTERIGHSECRKRPDEKASGRLNAFQAWKHLLLRVSVHEVNFRSPECLSGIGSALS
jgi:hypothetical protein